MGTYDATVLQNCSLHLRLDCSKTLKKKIEMPNYACCFQSNLKEGAQFMAAFNCGFYLPLWIGMAFASIISSPRLDELGISLPVFFGTLISCIASGFLWFGLRSSNAKIIHGSLIAKGIGAFLSTIGMIILSIVGIPPLWLAVVAYLALQVWIMLLVHGANQEIKNANTAAPSA